MKPLQTLLTNAASSHRKIVLSEGVDPRVVQGAVEACKTGVARVILLGSDADVRTQLTNAGGTNLKGITIIDPATSPRTEELAQLYYDLRKHKGVTQEQARRAAREPITFAALMVKAGHADGTISGAVAPTADVVRTALQVIGKAEGKDLVSSFFLMLLCSDHHKKKGAYVFADGGLVIDPDANQLAQIARESARSFEALVGETAQVAMLSFSTKGSGSHPAVSKVAAATELVRAADPSLLIDGELQFDAAFVADVASTKASGSPLAGNANVFVFPNLESGNIGYKIAQRIGGAAAVGPILQGLAKPANDLSRGCSSEDVLHMIAVTAAQADQQARVQGDAE